MYAHALPAHTAPSFQNQNMPRFEQFQKALKQDLGQKVFDAWFGAMKFKDFEAGTVTITVPETGNGFLVRYINKNYFDEVFNCAAKAWINVSKVLITSRSMVLKPYTPPAKETVAPKVKPGLLLPKKRAVKTSIVNMDIIKIIVTNYFDMRLEAIYKHGHGNRRARDIAIYLGDVLLPLSCDDIGAAFKTNGSVVEEIIAAVEKKVRTDPVLDNDINKLLATVGG